MNTFRKVIHEAIRESNLNLVQKTRLRVAMLLPSNRAKIEAKILEEAKKAKVVPEVLTLDSDTQLDIDWDKVKSFIKQYLPTLISLLIAILL